MAWSIFREGGGDLVAVGWAKQLLNLLGAPDTPGNEQFIYQWEKAEGGGGKYNPLNQGPVAGKPYLTTTGEQFGGGAADFASWDAGLQGAVDFLHYKQYSGVLQGLMSNSPASARTALWASPWAASHYGYGSNWPNVALPNGQAVLPPTGGGEAGLLTGSPDTHSLSACAWEITLPVTGDMCLMSNEQARAAFGIGFVILGFGIGVVAIAVLLANALKSPGKTVTSIANKAKEEASM